MATVEQPSVYEELLNLLAKRAEPKEVLEFQLSEDQQRRLDRLLEMNREGTLTAEESVELDTYEQFEHVVRLLKARIRSGRPQ